MGDQARVVIKRFYVGKMGLLIVIPYGLAIGRELPVSIKRLNYCLLYGRIREIST